MSGHSFIALPSLDLGEPKVSDRTGDLKSAIIDHGNSGHGIHVADATLARKWAAAFTQAAEMLEARGPDLFCAACGGVLPSHLELCPRGAK